MKVLLLSIVLLWGTVVTGQYWQQQADYVIDVRLNTADRTLDGFERLTYTNHSPDTLTYIWFHLWPNAYRNDRTAFSDQLLENGNTRFYFSGPEAKGYINRLDFRVDGAPARTEDHPEHIDIVKLLLPRPLPPGARTLITTPFHVKLPFNVSRSGYDGNCFQVTQWYPKPAVYDRKGWHPIPYLDQGEFYSEFGSFDVRITLPKNYVVAATGLQQNGRPVLTADTAAIPYRPVTGARSTTSKVITADTATHTLHFRQDRIHDFAWFADPRFLVAGDTLQLPSGRTVQLYAYYTPAEAETWKRSIQWMKDALLFRSRVIGEYPYDVATVVQGPESFGGGMEYPTITVISPVSDERMLEELIEHELGHNWFQGILATNERQHPWMDEGFNSYYDYRYQQEKYGPEATIDFAGKRLSLENVQHLLFRAQVAARKDQPIETPAPRLSSLNYNLIAYHKTALWLQRLEAALGRPVFDTLMQRYYRQWAFRHPYPEDFRMFAGEVAGSDLSPLFAELEQKGEITAADTGRRWQLASPLLLRSYVSYLQQPAGQLLTISPALGRNKYDKLMVGAALTNYKLPAAPLQFFLTALYGTGSKRWNGLAQAGHSFFPGGSENRVTVAVSAQRFSKNAHYDLQGSQVYERFTKLSPSVRLSFAEPPRSTRDQWLEARSYFIRETNFSRFAQSPTDSLLYVDSIGTVNRHLHQLTWQLSDHRALYPYSLQLQAQGNGDFYRLNATARYYFNYADGGGLQLRAFGAAFGRTGNASPFATFRYQPKLLGVTGEEDYTYSNYFTGRTASISNDASVVDNSGLAARQIMIRDGGLKLRLDPFEFVQGRSERWVAALNLSSSLPDRFFPSNLPLRLFFDLGTYSEAWKEGSATPRFLYVGGLQVSLFKQLVNVYAPLVYSEVFRESLKSLPGQNTFLRRLTFSIDIHRFRLKAFTQNQLLF